MNTKCNVRVYIHISISTNVPPCRVSAVDTGLCSPSCLLMSSVWLTSFHRASIPLARLDPAWSILFASTHYISMHVRNNIHYYYRAILPYAVQCASCAASLLLHLFGVRACIIRFMLQRHVATSLCCVVHLHPALAMQGQCAPALFHSHHLPYTPPSS